MLYIEECQSMKNTGSQMHLTTHAYQVTLVFMYKVTLHVPMKKKSHERKLVTLLLNLILG